MLSIYGKNYVHNMKWKELFLQPQALKKNVKEMAENFHF